MTGGTASTCVDWVHLGTMGQGTREGENLYRWELTNLGKK